MITTERRRARVGAFVPLVVLSISLFARTSRADDAAQAELLFQEAKQLMANGRFDAACPKLAAAQAMHGGGGTLLALAMCHEGEGLLATALVEFREANAQAIRSARKDRADLAEARVRALEPRVSRVLPSGNRRNGITVQVDGTAVRDEQWTTGVPVDGGVHVVRVTAPGKRAWESRANVAAAEETLRVLIPELADEAPAPPSIPPGPSPAPATRSAFPLFVPAVVTIALGAASVGIGIYFGVRALGKKSESGDHCQGSTCDAAGVALNDDAKSAARVADIAIGAGAVLVAAGVIVLIVGPPKSASGAPAASLAPWAAPRGGGAALSAAF